MATVLKGFRLASRSLGCRSIPRQCILRPIGRRAAFHSTPLQGRMERWKGLQQELEDEDDDGDEVEEGDDEGDEYDEDAYEEDDDDDDEFFDPEYDDKLYDDEGEIIPPEPEEPHIARIRAKASRHWGVGEALREMDEAIEGIENFKTNYKNPNPEDFFRTDAAEAGYHEYSEDIDQIMADQAKLPKKKTPQSILNLGEDEVVEEEGDDEMFDDDDEYDNLTVIGHLELQQHREYRHYARLAAWDLPLLSKMCKPFEPPTADMALRFRYTTYMGEHHPAEKKVVVEFCPEDMPNLTDVQRMKLKKLAGTRYNPEKDIIKMSSEMYESQAQNKRYLGDRVDELLREARDPTDTFEDVPLDTRHHKFKPKHSMPKEWKMNAKRKADLVKIRQKSFAIDQERAKLGELVSGLDVIQKAFQVRPAAPLSSLPEMSMAARGKKVVSVRR